MPSVTVIVVNSLGVPLSSLTPSQVIERTGRLERQLNLGRKPYLDIRVAKKWVENAKRANSELTQ